MPIDIGGYIANQQITAGLTQQGIVTRGLAFNLNPTTLNGYPASGTTLYDTQNNIQPYMVNGPTVSSQGIVLDGTNDYVRIPFNNIFNVTSGDFSVMAWQKTIQSGILFTGIITSDSTGDTNWKIHKDNGKNCFSARTGNTESSITDFPNYTLNQFHCYAFTKSGSTAVTYLDGALGNTNNSSANPSSFSNDLALGSYRLGDATSSTWMANMVIGQILFYNRALTAQEVAQNFNATRSTYGV